MLFDIPKNDRSIIKVIGVGGGGGNAVKDMFEQGIAGVDFVICNTDNQALISNPVLTKIQLGPHLTEGRGAGSKPEIGKQACIESIEDIRTFLNDGTKMVFITAGMGGGTGTGAAPIIAKAAKEQDLLTVGIVTLPFKFEGMRRHRQALEGLEELKKYVDAILVISNDKVREAYGDLGLSEAFGHADEILTTAAKGIAEIITVPGYINVDFEDVNHVMRASGVAMMGNATAEGDDRARKAIHAALNSPLLEDNDIRGAQHILLNITSGTKEVTMDEIGEITEYVQEEAGHGTDLIWGNCLDESLGEKISITLIATGFVESDYAYDKSKREKIVVPLDDQDMEKEFGISVGYDEGDLSQVVDLDVDIPITKTFSHESHNQVTSEPFAERVEAQVTPKIFQEIDKDKMLKEQSRIKQQRDLSSKPIDNPSTIAELEKVPAYKRRNVMLDDVDVENTQARSRLSISDDEDSPLSRGNQFLYDNVD
jgi:cell division protein FtsZ